MKIISLLLAILLITTSIFACEFGHTKKNFFTGDATYNYPNSYELAVSNDGGAYYFPRGEYGILHKGGTIWERVHFKNERIQIDTGYTWCAGTNPPTKEKCPYVVYKGARWYPQYHGIIFVYEDGEEYPSDIYHKTPAYPKEDICEE